jgi:Flp pilus assembly protein TadB
MLAEMEKHKKTSSDAQHSTAQHSTAQHSTAQHSTAQHGSCCKQRHVSSSECDRGVEEAPAWAEVNGSTNRDRRVLLTLVQVAVLVALLVIVLLVIVLLVIVLLVLAVLGHLVLHVTHATANDF